MGTIILKNISKSYGSLKVLNHLNMTLSWNNDSGIYCLMGPSGSGKTTLIRLLLGLEKPDSGEIQYTDSRYFTAVFQEDRLCESFSPIENVMMVTGKSLSQSEVLEELVRLLPEECLTRPVSTLSGGMKRRVSLARAILAKSEGILMDEPFSGLDEDTRKQVISYILEKCKNKLLFISTHQEEDIELLNGIRINLITDK